MEKMIEIAAGRFRYSKVTMLEAVNGSRSHPAGSLWYSQLIAKLCITQNELTYFKTVLKDEEPFDKMVSRGQIRQAKEGYESVHSRHLTNLRQPLLAMIDLC